MANPDKLNKICDKIETLKEQLDIKQKIMDEIARLKAQCNGAPTFTIDASLPSLNINFVFIIQNFTIFYIEYPSFIKCLLY